MSNTYLSDYYFDLNKRNLLSQEEVFIFSRLLSLANDLISKLNNSNMDNNLKASKFDSIKSKINNCYSISLAMEYYSDLEFEIHKLESRINEYSNIIIYKEEVFNDKQLIIDTETKFISKKEDESVTDISNDNTSDESIKNNVVDLESSKLKDIDFYINNYSLKTNASREYILDVISHLSFDHDNKKAMY